MKDAFMIKLRFSSILFCPIISAGFEEATHNAQHCLITPIKKWMKSVDNSGVFGALFTGLSKTFDCYLENCQTGRLWF